MSLKKYKLFVTLKSAIKKMQLFGLVELCIIFSVLAKFLKSLILASTKQNSWILDPFTGSSTTGIAANLLNRRFLGVDQEKEYLKISKNRKLEIENPMIAAEYRQKLRGFNYRKQLDLFLINEPEAEYIIDLNLHKV